MNWKPPETAPKDGTVILGVFTDLFPVAQACTWNEPEQGWCVAVLQADLYSGERNDFYFICEYSSELTKWMPIPEVD